MVKNLEETGTPFDYKEVDFGTLMSPQKGDRYPRKKDQLVERDDQYAEDHTRLAEHKGLLVGYDSNPEKNQMFVDQERTFED